MGRVSGKVAIVTGAARGMGAAIARRLATEGAQVMLTDILDDLGAQTAKDIGARFLHHDVASADAWTKIFAETEAAFGPINVLVNNAGIGADAKPIEHISEADYRRIVEVNQMSVFFGTQGALAPMKKAGGG